MSKRTIKKSLKKALLEGGVFEQELFDLKLKVHIEEFTESKKKDKDEYFFAITENKNDIAMLFIDDEDKVHANENARALLEKVWGKFYKFNIRRMLSDMAVELDKSYLFFAGIKIAGKK